MTEALINKYRPQDWGEVFGQDEAVSALSSNLGTSRAFLLSGTRGVGKTTLARIAAAKLDAERTEIAAADHTGVDDMRALLDVARSQSLIAAGGRAIILDECHRLSRNAWDVLLKPVEEPSAGVCWFFCTTEASKVPAAIVSRCVHLKLRELRIEELKQLYGAVCEFEGISLPGDVGDIIIKEAGGSARQMLSNLAACRGVASRQSAIAVLRAAVESDATIELCRFMAAGRGSWMKAASILKQFAEDGINPEGVRIVVCNYFAKMALGSERDLETALPVLDAFCAPFSDRDGAAPLVLAVGRVMFGSTQ